MLPGAPPEPDALPVYGEASDQLGAAGPEVEVHADRASRRPSGLVVVLALAVALALVVATTAVRRLVGEDPSRVELLESHEVVDLPRGVTAAPTVAWRAGVEPGQLLPLGDVVVVSEEGAGGRLLGLDASDGDQRWRVRVGSAREEVRWLAETPAGDVLVGYGPPGTGSRLRVAVVDVGDGSVRWRSVLPGAEFSASWGDRVALFSRHGSARSYDVTLLAADDGAVRGRSEGQPVGFGQDSIYLTRADELVAVDRRTGKERWSRDADPYAAIDEVGGTEVAGTLIVGRSHRAVVGLSVEDGSFQWSRSFAHPVWAARTLGDLAVVLSDETAYGIDPTDGSVLWEVDNHVWRFARFVRLDGRDDVHVLDERVARMNTATGQPLTRAAAPAEPRSVYADVELADGVIYTLWADHEVRGLDPVSLKRRWSIEVDEDVVDLAAADDTVVVTTRDELIGYR